MSAHANSSSIADILRYASQQLKSSSDSPLLDAQLLLASILDKDRSYLLAWSEVIPTSKQQDLFKHSLSQRLEGIPIAYILGVKEFWSIDFKVTPDVLIPRPETELLVDTVIEACSDIKTPKILELGTGSGAIAVALAKELPNAQITATDLSIAALEVAQTNALRQQVNNIGFIQSDWFTHIPECSFDIIVSNPPYIEDKDPHLMGDIRHEPLQALASGEDGLDDIRVIVANAKAYLSLHGPHDDSHGRLLLEHGYNQGARIRTLMEDSGFTDCLTLKDYGANDRVTSAEYRLSHSPS